MADEIEVTQMRFKAYRGDLIIYSHQKLTGERINASATQDNTAAFGDDVQMVSVLNNGTQACNIVVWDEAGTVTVANSQPISPGERLDIMAYPGQLLSSKIV